MNQIVQGDNLEILRGMEAESVELIYIDPPFNTGKRQARTQMKTVQDGQSYRVWIIGHFHQGNCVNFYARGSHEKPNYRS